MIKIKQKITVFNVVLSVILLLAIAFSAVKIVMALDPNPGHIWSEIDDVALGETQGGTDQTTYTKGDVLYSDAANNLAKRAIGLGGYVLASVNGIPDWVATSTLANISGTLGVTKGGTGVATLGNAGVLIGNDAGTVQVTGAGNAGQVLTSNGAGVDPTFQAAAGGNDSRLIMDALNTGEQHDVTASTALTKITALSQTLAAGTYTFKYSVIYRSNQLTEGIRLAVNYSGNNGAFVWWWRWADLSAIASTAVPDQDDVDAAGNVMGVFQSRAESTTTRGVTLSVDTINADMMVIIEGVFVATGAGDLELWHGSETATAGYTTSVMIGTSVEINKTK